MMMMIMMMMMMMISRKPEGKSHSEDIGIDGKIILEWVLEK
jgi:hypothetical protein